MPDDFAPFDPDTPVTDLTVVPPEFAPAKQLEKMDARALVFG